MYVKFIDAHGTVDTASHVVTDWWAQIELILAHIYRFINKFELNRSCSHYSQNNILDERILKYYTLWIKNYYFLKLFKTQIPFSRYFYPELRLFKLSFIILLRLSKF